MKTLPKANPENSPFKNLKPFQKNPVAYMQSAVEAQGSPVDLNLPMGDFVVLNDPEQFAEVFAAERTHYTKSRGYKEIALVLGKGLLTAEGEEWHEQRKALQPSFHQKELRKLLPSIWETGARFTSKLCEEQVLRLDEEMSGLTMTILLNSLIKYQDEQMVTKMSEHILFGQDFIVDRIRSPFKWPVWVPTKTNKQYHRMMQEANDIIQGCVDNRKLETEKVDDLLNVLMEFYDADEQFIDIRNQLLTLLVAGHETSAIAMTWTLHLLAHHPEIQERLYQEIKDIKSFEDMDVMNFSNTTYLQQVIKESLRYYPPIWNIVRLAQKDHQVGGVDIKAGKQLMLNIFLMHRNEAYWSDANVFNPDRFDKPEFKHKQQYLPFGGGGRFCIGNNFALYEIMILLIQFVRDFEILPNSPEFIDFNPLLTLRPKDAVNVTLKRRK